MRKFLHKTKPYYISLGAGENQVPLILSARKKFRIIGVDQDLSSVGMQYCDLCIEESVTNYQEIYKKILVLTLDADIVGVYACSYGNALVSGAFLSEKLQLPGLSGEQTNLLTDKFAVRNNLKNVFEKNDGFFQPKYYLLSNVAEVVESLEFPLLLKDKTGHAKKNIFLIQDEEQLRKIVDPDSVLKEQIAYHNLFLEEFIPGEKEITVVGLVDDGKFSLISITDKTSFPKAPFVDLEHIYPSQFSYLEQDISAMHQAIVDQQGLSHTPLVSEWKYHNDQFCLMEISPQVPGELIAKVLIPRVCRYDYFANLVNLTSGTSIKQPKSWSDARHSFFKTLRGMKIKYYLQPPPEHVWDQCTKESVYYKVLNQSPNFPPKDNHDRYAVIASLEKIAQN